MVKRSLVRSDWILLALSLLIALVAVLQTYRTLNDYARLWRMPLWRMRTEPALSRSAEYFLGGEGAEYLDFIATVVPPGGRLATVPGPVRGFSSQNILKFFLTDRTIISCGGQGQDMVDCLTTVETFLPAVGEFPPQAAVDGLTWIPYPAADDLYRGIYAPTGYAQTLPAAEPAFRPLLSLFGAGLVIAALFTLGGLITSAILGRLEAVTWLMLGLPLGAGLHAFAVFLWSWAGGRVDRLSTILLFLAMVLVLLAVRWRQSVSLRDGLRANLRSLSVRRLRIRPIEWTLLSLIGLLWTGSVVIAVGRGYSMFDGMAIWSLKGYVIAQEETILAAARASGHGLAYPLNHALNVATVDLLRGDQLPGSKLLFPGFTTSLLIGCVWFWHRHGLPRPIALLGALLLLSVPLIFEHSTYGFANLPFSVYLTLGFLWSMEGFLEQKTRVLLLGGLLLSLAGWTRPEGIGFAFTLAMPLAAFGVYRRVGWRPIVFWLVSIGSTAGIWLIFGTSYLREDQIGGALQALMEAWQGGELRFSSLTLIRSYGIDWLLTPRIWGWIVPLGLFLSATALIPTIRNRDRLALPVFGAATLAALLPALLFFTESFDEADFRTFLTVSFNRAYFPAVIFLTLLALLMLRNWKEEVARIR